MTKKVADVAKKPVDTVREDLRVLSAAADAVDADTKNWITPEFVSMVSTVAVNLLTAATLVGWVDAAGAQELAKAITGVVTAIGTVSVNGMIVWKYLAGRQQAQALKLEARYRVMESLAVERMRAGY